MKKLGLFLFACFASATFLWRRTTSKSLERNVPGQGKVTIHQDPALKR